MRDDPAHRHRPTYQRPVHQRPVHQRPVYQAIKRLFDIAVAGAVLLVTSPLLLLVALAIKLSSPGPVFYRAPRAGRHGVKFHMLKFRTMRMHSDSVDRRVTEANDDRITPVGVWLRRLKIDELPQLWNVLLGDMSIVGPRPEDWDIVQNHYTAAHRRSLLTRPGIACTAEVRWYPDLTFHDPPPAGVPIQQHYIARHMPAQAAEGVRYVEQQDLWLDLRILLHTMFCILVHSWWPQTKRPPTAADMRVPAGAGPEGRP
jgi:lipopolysaccharide/colanic/teichoic acid biosynthesis glycosyltransferase